MYSRTKNRISLNLAAACNRGCSYCIQEKDAWYRALREKAAAAVMDSRNSEPPLSEAAVIMPGEAPAFAYSLFDCSDYFLLRRQPYYRAALDSVLRMFCRPAGNGRAGTRFSDQQVMLTVRPGPGDQVDGWLLAMHHACRLTMFVSFGSLNAATEPDTFRDRLRFMIGARQAGLHVVPLFKPLVTEWFDLARAHDLLAEIVNAADSVVAGGLKLTPALVRNLRRAGVAVPIQPYSESAAYLDRGLLAVFAAAVRALKPVSVYKHRLCAMYEYYRLPCRTDCREREFCSKRPPLPAPSPDARHAAFAAGTSPATGPY
ncbi:MAG TPA: hypothetical protein PKM88_03760 [bacterium]|nr:hypothetical protein [bacterium]